MKNTILFFICIIVGQIFASYIAGGFYNLTMTMKFLGMGISTFAYIAVIMHNDLK